MNYLFHSTRSGRGERSVARPRAGGEAGVSLIELLIAITIFAVVASGVAVGMGSALGLTRNNRNRSVAANLAATEMDIVRSTKFESLPLTDVTTNKTVTEVSYTILRQTSWVSKDGTGGVCSPPAGAALAFLRVLVTVTWPDMQGVEPVVSETILAPPIGAYNSDLGHLAVMVRDRNAAPLPGVVVTAVGPGGTFTQTTVGGCAFFAGLAPGQFDVSLNTAGFVDDQNEQNPVGPLTITAGSITSGEFVYDRSSTLNLSLVGIANYGVPNGMGARVANTGLALGDVPFASTGGSSCGAPPTTLYSSGDASVYQFDPNSTYGTSSQTLAGTYSKPGANARFLVRFDLPAAPAGCSVGTATLRVYDRVPSSSTRSIQAYQANSAWSEGSVNWNNQPATTGSPVATDSPASPDTWMSWGVTSIVQAHYAGTNNGFLLKDSAENGPDQFNQFDVRELPENDPELVITWAVDSACSTGTVGATADARVLQSSGSSNYGSETTLQVLSQDGNRNERTLIKFNLPTDPEGCQFAGAELRLYQESGDSGRTIRVYRSSASWSESSITWNNKPATTGSPVSAPSSGSLNLWMSWDVSSLVNTMYSGSNDGFVLSDSSENDRPKKDQRYQSRENGSSSTRPELVLTYVDSSVLPTSQRVTGAPLFPYLNGYQAWGGTCHDADPQGVNPITGAAYYPGAQREAAIASNPNQTTTAAVTLKSMDLRVRLSDDTAVAGAAVVAYHDPDNGCTSGQALNLGSTGSDGYIHVALPYGTWRFQVTSRTPVGSWPTSVLSPTTTNPQSDTVTVN